MLQKLIRFARKPAGEQFQAARATVRRHLLERDKVRIQRTLESAMAAPKVIRRNGTFYASFRPDSDVVRHVHPEIKTLSEKWTQGNLWPNGGDLSRFYALVLNVKQVMEEGVPGDIAELGVYRGNSAAILAHYARSFQRKLFLFDTFTGFDVRDLKGFEDMAQRAFADSSIDVVRDLVGSDSVTYCKGYFPDSIPSDLINKRFSVVHIDCDLYEPTKAGLDFFYPRLSSGGLVILHDYSSPFWEGVKNAVDEFCATIPEKLILLPDKSGSAMIRKSSGISP